jgi:hypothetical protein
MAVSCCILVSQSFWKAGMAAVAHHCSCVHLQNPPKSWCKCWGCPCPSMSFPWDAWQKHFQSEQWQFSFALFLSMFQYTINLPWVSLYPPTFDLQVVWVMCMWINSCNHTKYQHASPIQPHTVTHTSLTNSSQLKLLIWIAGTEAIGARIRTLATSGLFLDRGSRLWW